MGYKTKWFTCMFRFNEQRNIARLNFLSIKVYRETQSCNKDSKNHFGQFKENISEQSLPKNIFIIKKFKRFSFWMQIFFVNLVHSSKYFVLVLFTLSWMKRVTASLEFITVHSCLVTKSKIPGVWIIESNHHYREERCC